ncbi:MAG: globin family protein [Actinomycetota bacterium]
MTPNQIALVQNSFAQVAPIADQAAALFYGRVFELAPQTRGMFKEDLTAQGRKLMRTLGIVVDGLNDLDAIVPIAQAMAVRHVDYGVEAEHYTVVGEALLWTLGQGLGDGFTTEVEEAWAAAYGILTTVMIDAAYPAPAAT